MNIYRPLTLGLFIYECIRLVFLVGAFVVLKPGEETAFPWLIYAAPNALFPLMALFLTLDISRYRKYLPLYAAGKYISLFSILGWYIYFRLNTTAWLSGHAVFFLPFIAIMLLGDTLTAAAGLLIMKKTAGGGE